MAAEEAWRPRGLRLDVAHSARIYDYWLGGKDNFLADREAAAEILAVHPAARTAAVENRAYLHRVVRHLAVSQGIRQFLDIGTGIPTSPNAHEVAQAVAPDARVVYVDNDPMVLAHARALMSSTPQGRTAFLEADLHDPESILKDPRVSETLDLDRPVGLLLVAVLHFFPDDAEAHAILRRLLDQLAPGSFAALSHGTYDFPSPSLDRAIEMYAATGIRTKLRTRAEFTALLDGLEIQEPGVVPVAEWRRPPSSGAPPTPEEVSLYAALARKPG